MTEISARDFRRYEQEAWLTFRHGLFFDHRGLGVPYVCYREWPSFDDPVSIEVFGFAEVLKRDYTAVRSRWCKEEDRQRIEQDGGKVPIRQFHPTFETERAVLRRDDFEPLFRGLCAADLPILLPNSQAGLDGEVYELELHHDALGVRLSWWCDFPKHWKPIKSKVNGLLSYLRRAFDKKPG